MKPATVHDVAEHAAVSVASVSRVLNGAAPVAEATRQRVLDAIEALDYVAHSGARSLSTSRTNTIGVILPDLFGEYFSELIRGMDLAARRQNLHLIVSSSHGGADEAIATVRSMRGLVDGMIVLSPHIKGGAGLAPGRSGSAPVLLMNGAPDGTARPSIVVDNYGGAITAVGHLVDLGRRSIVHLAGPSDNIEARARLAGYLKAMADAGLAPRVVEGDFDQSAAHRRISDMLESAEAMDAVFAANDMMGIGALLALQEAGVRCPDDVAIIGFDDISVARLIRPALSSMTIDIVGCGRRAVERLALMMSARPGDAPDTACEIVRPVLVIRGSSLSDPSNRQISSDTATAVSEPRSMKETAP